MAFYDDIPNVANCSDVAQLYECALLTINNSKLLRDWVNGDENKNVTLGGKSVPSLRKLVQNINRVAGIASSTNLGAVRPDNTTIGIDESGIISVIAAGIIKNNGGLVTSTDGKLVVDFSTMPADMLKPMLSSLIQIGGGLSVNNQGKFYFDAESMDTAVFDRMLKALRLPKWLTANTHFYVDKSHANASDTLDEGRGLSASKPFKTIQACVDYVTENFNVGVHTAFINIAPGQYNEVLVLPSFSRTSGSIYLRPSLYSEGEVVIVNNAVPSQSGSDRFTVTTTGAGFYILKDLTIKRIIPEAVSFRSFANPIRIESKVRMDGCHLVLDSSAVTNSTQTVSYICQVITEGNLEVSSSSRISELTHISKMSGSEIASDAFANCSGFYINGNLRAYAAIVAEKQVKVNFSGKMITGIVVHGGYAGFDNGPFRALFSETGNGINYRYQVIGGGKLETSGAGPEYFPGNVAGTVDAASYSWYK